MGFSIANTSPSAVITKIGTPSSVTGDLTITGGALPLSEGGNISGTNTIISDQNGSPNGTIQMFLKQGDAKIDTFVNNTLYSSKKYSSGIAPVLTPVLGESDSLTMLVSDPSFDCYDLTSNFSGSTPNVLSPLAIVEQPDGKLIFGGSFETYKGESYSKIIRLNPDFSIDRTFNIGSGFDSTVFTITLQPDGKIMVGGTFTGYNETNVSRIVRLNSDGSIDTTFQSGTGAIAGGGIQAITIQPDNKILVGGQGFNQYSGVSVAGIVRLNSNGSIDETFSATLSTTLPVFAISLQSDGKMIVGGGFTTANGESAPRIVRLETDGSVDTTFSAGTGFNLAARIVNVESDGKIMVGGLFSGYNGSESSRIIRLNSDGSIDDTFVVGAGFTQTLLGPADLRPQSITKRDDKYLVTGQFQSYQGETNKLIVRLNNDGSIDSTFNTDGGFDYPTVAIAADVPNAFSIIKSNGEIVVAGVRLGTYEGQSLTGVAVLTPFGGLLNCE